MRKLVLLRHGESEWNKKNLFTGWTDVPLSEKGMIEAKEAGRILKSHHFEFDLAFVSLLKRSLKTLWIVLEELDHLWIPCEKSWRLNERHYGALQGLNKKETAEKYGKERVQSWRRSYRTKPLLLPQSDERFPGNQRMYHNIPDNELPVGESLKETVNRFLPYWEQSIVPEIKNGKKVIIAAHGNSLRALVKHLDSISDDDISSLEIPTGKPLVYELNDMLKPEKHYYLG